MATQLDPARLLARPFPPVEHTYTHKDTALYALSLGLGADPLDTNQLRYVYEGIDGQSLRAFSTLANVLGYPGFWAREPDTGIRWERMLHAEQETEFFAPLPASGTVVGQNRLTGLWDKGPEKGAFLQQQRDILDTATDTLLARVTQLNLMRGDGGFGAGGTAGAPPAPHRLPDREPDATCDLPTLAQTALLYRLTGDLNPLHADPHVARLAGMQRPILHGMATMGIAVHAVLKQILNYDDARIKRIRVRFSGVVYPGDTLRTQMWLDGPVISLRTIAVERGATVLNNSLVELRTF